MAIKCFVCNSLKDQGCTSSKPPSASYLKDCNELFGGDKATVCRKIDQSVPYQDGCNKNINCSFTAVSIQN